MVSREAKRLLKLLDEDPERAIELGAVSDVNPKKQEEAPTHADDFSDIKIQTVRGSSAGAGSSDFHEYRKYRRTEVLRVETLEEQAAARKEMAEFEATQKALEAANQRDAAKRKSKAEKKKERLLRARNRQKAEKLKRKAENTEQTTENPAKSAKLQ